MGDKLYAQVPDALVILKRTETGTTKKTGEPWKRDTVQIRTKAKSGEEYNFFCTVPDRIKGLYDTIQQEMKGLAEIVCGVNASGYFKVELLSFEPVKGVK